MHRNHDRVPSNQLRKYLRMLYFPIDGKVKEKDLEFYYKGPAGRLSMIFKK